MSDTRILLERISAFRQRLDGTAQAIPDAVPVESDTSALAADVEAFRQSVRLLTGFAPPITEGPVPQYTARAKQLLASAKQLVERQRAVSSDPLSAGIEVRNEEDPLVAYQRDTVAILDAIVRQVQSFPDSPGAQLKLCDGLDAMLVVVQDRIAIQERALEPRRASANRIDRLAGFLTALHSKLPANLDMVAALAEEILEGARQGKPLRLVHAEITSTHSVAGGAALPVPARFVAAHAINAAQVIARIVPFDYEWAGRPLLPVVATLLMDCGMLAVPVNVLSKPEPLTADERRAIEAHAKYGAELLLWRFPTVAGPIAAAVATHHERADGTGYPAGLRNDEVPALGRLLRVADVYAALCEERPHRAALDTRMALTEVLLMAEQGEVDRDFAEYLLNLAFYPVGSLVELTDGRVGVVVANHPNRLDPRSPSRPVVAALTSADGTVLPRPEYVDLAAADSGGIVRGLPLDRQRAILGSRYPELVYS